MTDETREALAALKDDLRLFLHDTDNVVKNPAPAFDKQPRSGDSLAERPSPVTPK